MAAEFTSHFPEFLLNNDNFPDMFFHGSEILPMIYTHQEHPEFSEILEETNPRFMFSDSSDQKMSAAGSSCGDSNENIIKRRENSYSGRGKRARNYDKESEVVHVRARRGQATDKHSLAERVRRGKINEKLKCLQDIVPGCYKTMGMSVMLDETINYVQSLQSQVEFLSMKLTTASTFHDFNSELDFVDSPCSLIPSSTLYNWSET